MEKDGRKQQKFWHEIFSRAHKQLIKLGSVFLQKGALDSIALDAEKEKCILHIVPKTLHAVVKGKKTCSQFSTNVRMKRNA